MANLLCHLFGTVVGQAKAHDGQHHGDLVDGAVMHRGLNLSCYLPLQKERKKELLTRPSSSKSIEFLYNHLTSS